MLLLIIIAIVLILMERGMLLLIIVDPVPLLRVLQCIAQIFIVAHCCAWIPVSTSLDTSPCGVTGDPPRKGKTRL